jgi:hypothetical protein
MRRKSFNIPKIPLWLKKPIFIGTSVAGFLFLFYLACLHYTEVSHVKIMRNVMTGEILPDTPGWNLTAPWVMASEIDLRPMRVCITSASKGFNCKLIQFDSNYWQEFVATQGYHYWWWANRFSFNSGYDEEYRGMKDLMRGYAFATNQYHFVIEVDSLAE